MKTHSANRTAMGLIFGASTGWVLYALSEQQWYVGIGAIFGLVVGGLIDDQTRARITTNSARRKVSQSN